MLVCVCLAVIVSWQILVPHLSLGAPQAVESGKQALSLADQRARCVQVLKDLELDFSTHKISREDYELSRRSISAELAQILRELDELE